jgi:hypothetical protein
LNKELKMEQELFNIIVRKKIIKYGLSIHQKKFEIKNNDKYFIILFLKKSSYNECLILNFIDLLLFDKIKNL